MYKSFRLVRRYTGVEDYAGFPSEESAIAFAKSTPEAIKEGMEMHWPRPALAEPYRNEDGTIID